VSGKATNQQQQTCHDQVHGAQLATRSLDVCLVSHTTEQST
jgi:hypothetical protein